MLYALLAVAVVAFLAVAEHERRMIRTLSDETLEVLIAEGHAFAEDVEIYEDEVKRRMTK